MKNYNTITGPALEVCKLFDQIEKIVNHERCPFDADLPILHKARIAAVQALVTADMNTVKF